ncbi:histidine kinase, partial [Burkholderia pseudomallei]
ARLMCLYGGRGRLSVGATAGGSRGVTSALQFPID